MTLLSLCSELCPTRKQELCPVDLIGEGWQVTSCEPGLRREASLALVSSVRERRKDPTLGAESEEADRALDPEKRKTLTQTSCPRGPLSHHSSGSSLARLSSLSTGPTASVTPECGRTGFLSSWLACVRRIGRTPPTWLLSSIGLEAVAHEGWRTSWMQASEKLWS